MGRFEDASARLNQRLKNRVSVDIIYHAGDIQIPLKATVGVTGFRISDRDKTRVIWSDRDYLIEVADLVSNSVKILPEDGHWIEQITPQGLETFEVSAPEGEQTWRYSDPEQTVYRIHTKKKDYSSV